MTMTLPLFRTRGLSQAGVANSTFSLLSGLSAAALGLLLAACGPTSSSCETGAGAASESCDAPLKIAFFSAASDNGPNVAMFAGIQRAAEAAGGVEVEIFDGEFSIETQSKQIEDAVKSGEYDGYIIFPNDSQGLIPAAQTALDAGPTATAFFPIGPDIETLEPQLDGIITVAGSIADTAQAAGEAIVDYCEDKDPCRVVHVLGLLDFSADTLRRQVTEDLFSQHDNIEIIATVQGQYSAEVAQGVVKELLVSNPEFEVLLGTSDQHTAGALVALSDAGVDVGPMWISGGGASTTAIDGIKAGTWDASTSAFPETEGAVAAENVIKSLRGEPFEQVNDSNKLNPLGVALVTAAVLEANPEWVPEWEG